MEQIEILDCTGNVLEKVEVPFFLSESVFNKLLVAEVVRSLLSNKRLGTSSTLTRSFVRGSTRKIYRQKGTGNARHGDRKAPIFVGGGRVWGPHPRDYFSKIPKKKKRTALFSVLAAKYREGLFKVVRSFPFESIKTSLAKKYVSALSVCEALVVVSGNKDFVEKSFRNLPGFKVAAVDSLNVLDLLNYEYVLFLEDAFFSLGV